MHELSLCQNLLSEAHAIARREYTRAHPDQPADDSNLIITKLSIRIGLFSGIDKYCIQQAFDIALHDFHRYCRTHKDSDYRPLDNVFFATHVDLEVTEVPASLYCQECDQNYEITPDSFRNNYLKCTHNENHKTQLISADEVLLANITMEPCNKSVAGDKGI